MNGNAVSLIGVGHTYAGDTPTTSIKDIDLQIKPGSFVSIIGPSGCGKSTLLKLIAQLIEPTAGTILRDIGNNGTGYVFQQPVLLPWRTSLKNMSLPLELRGMNPSFAAVTASAWLERLGLNGFGHHLPSELSGGMQQRVALARALATNPALLCMDEPFSSVDELTRSELNELVLSIWYTDRPTTVLVTHSISEAIYMSSRVIVLSKRPASVIDDVDVPFEYPRAPELMFDGQFEQLVNRIRMNLR